MSDVEARLRDLSREFVEHHLPALLGLLGEKGASINDQRERADKLVRSLTAATVVDGIDAGSGRQVVHVDPTGDPPTVQFNGRILGNIDEFESLDFFEEPAAQILGLPRLRVGLLLQLRDEETLKRIRRRAEQHDNDLVGLADIPAVVRFRLESFVDRVRQLILAWQEDGAELQLDVDIDDGVEALVQERSAHWPSWDRLSELPLVHSLTAVLGARLDDTDEAPSPELLVRFCWESLDLSAQSLLREAARQLRSEHTPDLDYRKVFETLGELDSDDGDEVSAEATEWSSFEELAEAWDELFRAEQELLAWAPRNRPTPPLSVYLAPRESLGLAEPESLPWAYPLLCWSTREQQALRDLLDGHRQSLANHLEGRPDLELDVDELKSSPEELVLDDRRGGFEVEVGRGANQTMERMTRDFRRAFRAVYQTMYEQFESMTDSHQQRVIQRMRSTFDGYFQNSAPVWERRFEALDSLAPEEAFERLAGELRHLMGPRALLDPFESPGDPSPQSIPQFTFTMALPEDGSPAEIGIPLAAVRRAYEEGPPRIRLVEVPEADDASCRWLGDRTLTLRSLSHQPTSDVLESIEEDCVGILVQP